MLPIWLNSALDLLAHGELHYTLAEEFDARVALISFDNAIETSIACYLKLHPIQRGNRQYPRDKVAKFLENYHSKIAFLFEEVVTRQSCCPHKQDEIIYVHAQRSTFYHDNPDYVPAQEVLDKTRNVAIWIFSFLFEINNTHELLASRIKTIRQQEDIERDQEADASLDSEGETEVLGLPYKTSDVLFAADPKRYAEYVKEYKERNDQGAVNAENH